MNVFKRLFMRVLRRTIERDQAHHFANRDYSAVIELTKRMRSHSQDLRMGQWKAKALCGLEQYSEALDVVTRLEGLLRQQRESMTPKQQDVWERELAKLKCRILFESTKYGPLASVAYDAVRRFPTESCFRSYEVAASLWSESANLADSVRRCDVDMESWNEAWEYLVMFSAQRWLGNTDRARAIAVSALERFADDPRIMTMYKESAELVDTERS